MSGTAIISAMLLDRPDLLALVPVDRIKAGAIAPDIKLPALLIKEESSIDRQRLKQGTIVRSIDRISVTVRATTYREQKAIIAAVRRAAVGERRTIADATNVSSRTAGRGPDMRGPGMSFEKTQDFRVTYDAAA